MPICSWQSEGVISLAQAPFTLGSKPVINEPRARGTERTGRISSIKTHTLSGQTIQIRGLGPGIAVCADDARRLGISDDDNKILCCAHTHRLFPKLPFLNFLLPILISMAIQVWHGDHMGCGVFNPSTRVMRRLQRQGLGLIMLLRGHGLLALNEQACGRCTLARSPCYHRGTVFGVK